MTVGWLVAGLFPAMGAVTNKGFDQNAVTSPVRQAKRTLRPNRRVQRSVASSSACMRLWSASRVAGLYLSIIIALQFATTEKENKPQFVSVIRGRSTSYASLYVVCCVFAVLPIGRRLGRISTFFFVHPPFSPSFSFTSAKSCSFSSSPIPPMDSPCS